MDVCPRKGVNEGHGGGDAWGGKVVKIAGPMRAFLVERQQLRTVKVVEVKLTPTKSLLPLAAGRSRYEF